MSNENKLDNINISIIYKEITKNLDIILLNPLENTHDENNNSYEVIQLFYEILEYDKAIYNYGKYITTPETKEKFNNLKISLGKLQIIVLINKLNKSNNCKKNLNTFVNIINAEIEKILLMLK